MMINNKQLFHKEASTDTIYKTRPAKPTVNYTSRARLYRPPTSFHIGSLT